MGLTQLLDALEREAQREIESLRAAARSEAEAIAAESNARLTDRRRLALDEVDRRHRHELEQTLTASRRAARRAVLEARERLQRRVFDAVRALLPGALELETYRASLPERLGGALAALGAGPVVVRCTPSLRFPIEAVERPLDVSVVADDTIGSGFLAQTPDGGVAVVDILEERLERRRPELTRWVFQQAGGGA